MQWRAPIVARRVENNQGPVVAVVEFRVDADLAQWLDRQEMEHVRGAP
jgi:hypothetical protein